MKNYIYSKMNNLNNYIKYIFIYIKNKMNFYFVFLEFKNLNIYILCLSS
jgi:hypothetical protein